MALPAWLASMTQVPVAVKWTVPPVRVQPEEPAPRVMAAARPEVALAAGV